MESYPTLRIGEDSCRGRERGNVTDDGPGTIKPSASKGKLMMESRGRVLEDRRLGRSGLPSHR